MERVDGQTDGCLREFLSIARMVLQLGCELSHRFDAEQIAK
jgi:hypothetical protein